MNNLMGQPKVANNRRDKIIQLRNHYQSLSEEDKNVYINSLSVDERRYYLSAPDIFMRDKQLVPGGDIIPLTDEPWRYYLIQAGRSFGKGFAMSGWFANMIRKHGGSGITMALMGATYTDVQDVMLAAVKEWFSPNEYSNYVSHKIAFYNGTIVRCFSSETEGALGSNLAYVWCDEIGKWAEGNAEKAMRRYEDLRKAVRKLEYCQIGLSSTPVEQHPFFVEFEDEINKNNKLFIRVVGSTAENVSLSKTYQEAEKTALRGSRRDNQEYFGILNRDNPNAYWNGKLLDECKDDLPLAYPALPTDPVNTFLMGQKPMPPNTAVIDGRLEYVNPFGQIDNGTYLVRVIIGFDPAIKKGNDECGIVVGYLYSNNIVYIVEDASGQYNPNEWAQKIKELYVKHKANGVVVETNQGGDMIENTLRTTFAISPKVANLIVIDKFAKERKEIRAEATSTYYAQGKVKHLKTANLILLEKQMTSYNYQWTKSPDRIDALNMVCNELMFKSPTKKVKSLGQHEDLRDFSALTWSNK